MRLHYHTLSKRETAEIVEKKSRFIADAAPANTEAEALSFIAAIKAQYPDARHHVYAYSVQEDDTLYVRYSDDGEPQGTGGLPVLDVLKKKQVENTVIVVTRYFGGILLGAPGLTRAYAGSAAEVVGKAGIVPIYACKMLSVTVTYADTGRMQNLLSNLAQRVRLKAEAPVFTHEVIFPVQVYVEDVGLFRKAIVDGTDARAVITVDEAVQYIPLNQL